MAHFLFHLPGKQLLTPADAARLGISHLLEGEFSAGYAAGPGGSGAVLSLGQAAVIDLGRQTWHQVGPELWLGQWNGEPIPTPQELERPRSVPGEWVVLGDGQEWHVPRAIRYSEQSLQGFPSLPTRAAIGPDGQWTAGEVIPKFRELWDRADWMMKNKIGETPFTQADLADLVSLAISLNYRVSRFELAAMGALTFFDDVMLAAGEVVIGWRLFEELAKKKFP